MKEKEVIYDLSTLRTYLKTKNIATGASLSFPENIPPGNF